jgi:hypothetical protein
VPVFVDGLIVRVGTLVRMRVLEGLTVAVALSAQELVGCCAPVLHTCTLPIERDTKDRAATSPARRAEDALAACRAELLGHDAASRPAVGCGRG